jgi:glycosyltransferase involved in cell wall biosynthesis
VSKLLISVILPIYNGERYLLQSLGSVIAQTDRDWELIVVDDGSTDSGPDLIQSAHGPIRYVRQSNAGTAAARNTGVRLARGELLAFLDQDDYWEPRKLEWQRQALEISPQLDGVFGHVLEFYDLPGAERQEAVTAETLKAGILPSAMLLRRAAFDRVGLFDPRWNLVEWSDWYARSKEAGLDMRVLPQCVAWRRIHPGNKGNAGRASQIEYARVFKAALDRRRARDKAGGDVPPDSGSAGTVQ